MKPQTPAIDYRSFADLYDAFISFGEDIPFFVDEATKGARPVLELMAGTGRISVPLLEAGVSLTCVDRSPEMLAVLRRKLEERRLSATVLNQDVRRLEVPRSFDLAILPFHSFSELLTEIDQRRALRSIHGALAPGGRFICTLHNPSIRRQTIDGRLRVLSRVPHPDGRGELVVRTRAELDAESGLVAGTQIFEEYDRGGRLRNTRSVEARFTLPTREAFESIAKAAGFQVRALYGDYRRADHSPDESPYLIWDLQRGGE